MDEIKQEYEFSMYEVITILSNKSDSEVAVVKYIMSQKKYIRKKLRDNNGYHIYRQLKENPHINIASVEEIITYNDAVYVFQEFVEGTNIEQLLQKEQRLDKKQAVAVMDQISDGLIHLHQLNPPIIHRDLKPSNIMITLDGTVKIIDFDASRNYNPNFEKDTYHLGTQGYASPEQFGYTQTDIRSDIYSAGVLLREMLTGTINENKTIENKRLALIVKKSTKMDPRERYQSFEDLKKALHKYPKSLTRIAVLSVILFGIFAVGVLTIVQRKEAGADVLVETIPSTSYAIVDESEQPESKDKVPKAVVETTADPTKIGSTEPTIQETVDESAVFAESSRFTLDLAAYHAEDNYVHDLFEDEEINKKLKDTLKNEYDYLMECLSMITDWNYDTYSETYYMAGGMRGLFTIMEACVVLYQSGEVAGAYLYDDEIYYFTSVDNSDMHYAVFDWIYEKKDNSLHVDADMIEIKGTYVDPTNNNSVQISKDDTGYYMDLIGTFGVNVGGAEGYLRQDSANNWSYSEGYDEDRKIRLMFDKDKVLVFEYGTWGGMGVVLSGEYYRLNNYSNNSSQ